MGEISTTTEEPCPVVEASDDQQSSDRPAGGSSSTTKGEDEPTRAPRRRGKSSAKPRSGGRNRGRRGGADKNDDKATESSGDVDDLAARNNGRRDVSISWAAIVTGAPADNTKHGEESERAACEAATEVVTVHEAPDDVRQNEEGEVSKPPESAEKEDSVVEDNVVHERAEDTTVEPSPEPPMTEKSTETGGVPEADAAATSGPTHSDVHFESEGQNSQQQQQQPQQQQPQQQQQQQQEATDNETLDVDTPHCPVPKDGSTTSEVDPAESAPSQQLEDLSQDSQVLEVRDKPEPAVVKPDAPVSSGKGGVQEKLQPPQELPTFTPRAYLNHGQGYPQQLYVGAAAPVMDPAFPVEQLPIDGEPPAAGAPGMRYLGRVVYLSQSYGFIRPIVPANTPEALKSRDDVFVHLGDVGFVLNTKDNVTFELAHFRGRPKAVNVSRVADTDVLVGHRRRRVGPNNNNNNSNNNATGVPPRGIGGVRAGGQQQLSHMSGEFRPASEQYRLDGGPTVVPTVVPHNHPQEDRKSDIASRMWRLDLAARLLRWLDSRGQKELDLINTAEVDEFFAHEFGETPLQDNFLVAPALALKRAVREQLNFIEQHELSHEGWFQTRGPDGSMCDQMIDIAPPQRYLELVASRDGCNAACIRVFDRNAPSDEDSEQEGGQGPRGTSISSSQMRQHYVATPPPPPPPPPPPSNVPIPVVSPPAAESGTGSWAAVVQRITESAIEGGEGAKDTASAAAAAASSGDEAASKRDADNVAADSSGSAPEVDDKQPIVTPTANAEQGRDPSVIKMATPEQQLPHRLQGRGAPIASFPIPTCVDEGRRLRTMFVGNVTGFRDATASAEAVREFFERENCQGLVAIFPIPTRSLAYAEFDSPGSLNAALEACKGKRLPPQGTSGGRSTPRLDLARVLPRIMTQPRNSS